MLEGEKNRAAMKSLVCCTHFLIQHHSAHSTNFTRLVDLVLSCGARELQVFVENVSRNAVYTSQGAVADFIKALGTWVEEPLLKLFQKASVLVSWQVSALISWQWRNCQFSVIGRKMALLSNAFWTLYL